MHRKFWTLAISSGGLLAMSFLLARGGTSALLSFTAVWGLVIAIARPRLLLPGFAALAIVTVQPNLFGGTSNFIGVVALVICAILAVAIYQKNPKQSRVMSKTIVLPISLLVAYAWALGLSSATGQGAARPLVVGAVLMLVGVASIMITCSRPKAALDILRTFVFVTVLSCASYVVSLVFWVLSGPNSVIFYVIDGASYGLQVPVHAPFTTTLSNLQVFGITVPRFLGFGREPGWMALWAGASFFLYKFTRWHARWPKAILLIGALGTISTAGFALVVIAIALEIALGGRGYGVVRTFRRIGGTGLLLVSGWLAFSAPVVGINAKESQNAASLNERAEATMAGLRALTSDPFSGGQGAELVGSVNLIASIAVRGVPWALALFIALAVPLLRHPARIELLPFTLLLVGTLVIAQPSQDSLWAFCLVALATGVSTSHVRGKAPLPDPGSLISAPFRSRAHFCAGHVGISESQFVGGLVPVARN